MDIPRFWVRERGETASASGKLHRLAIWGWSSKSADDARAVARSRLARALTRLAESESPDRYPYGATPPREEIVEASPRGAAAGQAVVTRNRYGALVLNAARLLFIDVDLAPASALRKLGALFKRGTNAPDQEALDRLKSALAGAARATFRIYRTAGGFRVLAIDREFDPCAPETDALMRAAGADPRFLTLCRAQKSFRARLTPKPWRCGCPLPPGTFPREDGELARRFATWLDAYERASRNHASCHFVEQIGPASATGSLRALVELHDGRTRAAEKLPLA